MRDVYSDNTEIREENRFEKIFKREILIENYELTFKENPEIILEYYLLINSSENMILKKIFVCLVKYEKF